MRYFPYEYRPFQREIVNDVEETLNKKGHLILEAPTGIGKTIAVLAPSLEFALKNKLKIFYLTRTNSQQEQVIKEARKLKKEYSFTLVPIQGRNSYCMLFLKEKIFDATPEELAISCRKRKKDVENGNAESCIFYKNFLEKGKDVVLYAKENILTAQDFVDRSMEDEVCAYEAMKLAATEADILIMPYVYFFDPNIRSRLFEWINISIENTILIIDEAHNLPDFARNQRTMHLTLKSISGVDREIMDYGDDNKFGIKYSEFIEIFRETLFGLAEKLLKEKDDSPLNNEYLLQMLSDAFGTSTDNFILFLNTLLDYGEKIRGEKLSKGQLPRSFVGNLGQFLLEFFLNEDRDTVRIITKEEQLMLEMFAIDPKPVTSIIENSYASIHMSGTLRPLDEYESLIFNKKIAKKIIYPSPFPKNNLKVYYIDNVTTKFDYIKNDEEREKMAKLIEKIINTKHNSLVLFPSYNLMNKILERDIAFFGNVYKETPNMSQRDFIKNIHMFKRHGGVFFSVFGSRISEGMDFPGGQIELVVIAGIPYPKPSAKQKLMELYYSQEMDKNTVYKYLVHGPTGRRILQAIGRMIRSSTDRGLAIILDKRAPRFKEYIEMEKSKNIEEEIKTFYSNMASLK
ncbi:MAG: ATP-dependent DNA helicase [Thermoplasmata archaeon]